MLRFSNVKVPVENVIWGEGKGLKLALTTLNTGRLTLPASCAAGAKRAVEITRRWAAERVQWGKPIGKHDAVAQKLGRMAADTFAMQAVSDLASLLADRKTTDIRLEAAIAKMWNSEIGDRIIDSCLQIKGGRGYETVEIPAFPGRSPRSGRAHVSRLPDQPDLRGVERDHASLHCPRGTRHPSLGGRRPGRPEGQRRKEVKGTGEGRGLLCPLVPGPVAGLGTVAAITEIRTTRHACALHRAPVTQAGSNPLPRHGAVRTQARNSARRSCSAWWMSAQSCLP